MGKSLRQPEPSTTGRTQPPTFNSCATASRAAPAGYDAVVKGRPVTVALNRRYLLNALRFGLNQVELEDRRHRGRRAGA
jgi:hypothetical protein